jgi:flagellar hook-basal body complex protein FliE
VARPGRGRGARAGEGFGDLLARQIGNLTELQTSAAEASQALATGTASDPSEAVLAVSKAELSMQLAAQIRTRASEAFQDVFRTQV